MPSLRALIRLHVVGFSFLVLVAPFLVLAPSREAFAASSRWDGGGSDPGFWGDCDNWSGNVCPTGNDAITIGPGFSVWLDFFVLDSGGTLTIASGTDFRVEEFSNEGTIHNSGTMRIGVDDSDTFENFGTIINDGTIRNNGDIINRESGKFENNAGGIIVIRSFANFGNVLNRCGGTIYDDGLNGNPVINEPCSPSPATCDKPTITGTDNDDTLEGTSGDDVINGGGGNDVIYGLGGDDIICGGPGLDEIHAGEGDDRAYGGRGNDELYGDLGNDRLWGGTGWDKLFGGTGDDIIFGGKGNDMLQGEEGDDRLDGQDGQDVLDGVPDDKSFTAEVSGEKFVVKATDSQTIQQLTDNFNGANSMHVTGKLVRGDGGFNQPWSWHLDPSTVRMAEISIELCDGTPSMVEADLDYWLGTVGTFCPWGSKIVALGG